LLNPTFRRDLTLDEVRVGLERTNIPLALAAREAAKAEDYRAATGFLTIEVRWMSSYTASLAQRLEEAYEKIAKLELATWSSE